MLARGLNRLAEFVTAHPNLKDSRELPAPRHLFMQKMKTTVELIDRVQSQERQRHQARDHRAMVGTAAEELHDAVIAPRKISDGSVDDIGSETVEGQKIGLNNVGAARVDVYSELIHR